jgi:hypothetical protein
VLCHEFAHIARGDWLLQMFAELTRGLYCFHPLAWTAAARLRQERGHTCDDSVLDYGIAPFDYAHKLLDLARTFESPSRACAPAFHCHDESVDRSPPTVTKNKAAYLFCFVLVASARCSAPACARAIGKIQWDSLRSERRVGSKWDGHHETTVGRKPSR